MSTRNQKPGGYVNPFTVGNGNPLAGVVSAPHMATPSPTGMAPPQAMQVQSAPTGVMPMQPTAAPPVIPQGIKFPPQVGPPATMPNPIPPPTTSYAPGQMPALLNRLRGTNIP